jgi:hypothetical protein
VDPEVQYAAYSQWAYEHDLINYATSELIQGMYMTCSSLIASRYWELAIEECGLIVSFIRELNPTLNVHF